MAVGYSTSQVAKLLKVPESRLRALVRTGIIGKRLGIAKKNSPWRFDFRDLMVLRMAVRLLDNRVPLRRVARALQLLKQQIQSTTPLSGVQLFSEGGRIVVSDGEKVWEPESGQHHLPLWQQKAPNSQPESPLPAPPLRLVEELHTALNADPPTHANEWFDRGMALEDSEPHLAYSAYLHALELDPEHVEASINIGRLCSAAGEMERAAAYFRQALRLEPSHPVAHFNLAVSLHDLGELETARDAYRNALVYDPDFADAHYNLAAILEQLGDDVGASRHRQAYETSIHHSG